MYSVSGILGNFQFSKNILKIGNKFCKSAYCVSLTNNLKTFAKFRQHLIKTEEKADIIFFFFLLTKMIQKTLSKIEKQFWTTLGAFC